MSEIRNGRLELYCAKYLKCNHMMTLGFKGLSTGYCRDSARRPYTSYINKNDDSIVAADSMDIASANLT